MQYWRGFMNWPLDRDWKCPTCGERVLIWGFIHAQCRCDVCHTEFHMRDLETNDVVNIPILMLKKEYQEPAKLGYEHLKKPISEFSDDDWDYAFELVKGVKE
jgi:hypothetical protein